MFLCGWWFEGEMIDLGRLKGDIYVVFFYGFESDSGVDLRIIFVKICEEFNCCD